jgi:hypothetical protein
MFRNILWLPAVSSNASSPLAVIVRTPLALRPICSIDQLNNIFLAAHAVSRLKAICFLYAVPIFLKFSTDVTPLEATTRTHP